jgi:hypothetical protein
MNEADAHYIRGITRAAEVRVGYLRGHNAKQRDRAADELAGYIRELERLALKEEKAPEEERLEPNGGNVYLPHKLQVSSGEFWRCAHGNTGYDVDLHWIGCEQCAAEGPELLLQWAVKTLRFLMPGTPVGPHAAFEELVRRLAKEPDYVRVIEPRFPGDDPELAAAVEARQQAGSHPNNRLLFKDMCRFFGIELGKDTLVEARAKIEAYGATTLPPKKMFDAIFEAGWRLAASWAHRQDLNSDTVSPAYVRDRDAMRAELELLLSSHNQTKGGT